MKNLLLSTAILLTSASAFAQLSVKPNGSAETYMYVTNEVLYVTKDVTLTRNLFDPGQHGSSASIYLRDGAQLLQGDATSTNAGNGFLSVQQVAQESNAYAYNYWSSPVGNPNQPNNTDPGNMTFGLPSIYDQTGADKRAAVKALVTGDYNGVSGDPITISRRWIYVHDQPGTEDQDDYSRVGANSSIPAGAGFTMKGVGETTAPQNYDFRGRPNSGSIDIAIDGPVGDNGLRQFTLTGNPYPSVLDLNRLFYDTNNDDLQTILFYDEDRDVMSHQYSEKPFGYGTWVPNGSDPNGTSQGNYTEAPFAIYKADGTSVATGESGQNYPRRFAPVGQGFCVVGEATNNGSITIRNSHRRYIKEGPSVSVFNRTAQNNNTANNYEIDDNTTIDLEEYNPSFTRFYVVFDDNVTRDLLLTYSNEATDGFDRGYDGLSGLGLNNDAYFTIDRDGVNSAYAINAVNFEATKKVPFAFNLKEQANIKIMPVEQVNTPYNKLYLYDSLNNTYRAINNNDNAGLDLPAGKYEDRFFIVFMDASQNSEVAELTIAKNTILANVDFYQNNPQGRLEVSNPERYTLKSAALYDMGGKLVLNENNLGNESSYKFDTSNLSDGVYLVKLLTKDNISIDYKAIVHNKN